jgi:hypothetical protein
MKTYGEVNVSLHTFVSSVLERGDWSASFTEHCSARVKIAVGTGQKNSRAGIVKTEKLLTEPGIEARLLRGPVHSLVTLLHKILLQSISSPKPPLIESAHLQKARLSTACCYHRPSVRNPLQLLIPISFRKYKHSSKECPTYSGTHSKTLQIRSQCTVTICFIQDVPSNIAGLFVVQRTASLSTERPM